VSRFEGKTAVVTGGSSGIGLAVAERLAAEGAHVFVTGRRQKELDAAVETIGSATAVPGDISDPADLDRLYDAVRERGRGLDTVFANAGTAGFATLEETTEEHFSRIFDVNVRGTLFTVQKALPLLNEGASVIVNSSVRADDGVEAFGAYAASKAALRSYTRTWTREFADRGIRFNTLSPGPVDTPIMDGQADSPEQAEAIKARFAAAIPLNRMGRPEEIASAALFLASDDSSFVAGAELSVDGGMAQV